MATLYTTQEAAQMLDRSYDYTRKALRSLEPVKVIGLNKFWSRKQIESVRPAINKTRQGV